MMLLWGYAHEAWPNYDLPRPGSPEALAREEAWMDQLGDLSGELIREALNVQHIAQRDWFPPLGVIREEALFLAGHVGPPDAGLAWEEVQRQIRKVGYDPDRDPEWSHPAIAAAVKAVGWRVLCMSREDDSGRFWQWKDIYGSASKRIDQQLKPPAPGLARYEKPRELPGG